MAMLLSMNMNNLLAIEQMSGKNLQKKLLRIFLEVVMLSSIFGETLSLEGPKSRFLKVFYGDSSLWVISG